MKKRNQFINLLLISGLLFALFMACEKTDNQNTGKMEDADGNMYNTVEISNQVWMAENLRTTKYNDGTEISNVTDDTQWGNLLTGAFCNYDNLESNAATYGRLYNWYAVNTGKLAPVGWHVPTDDDWTTLWKYVDTNPGVSGSAAKALASKTNWAASTEVGAIGNDLTINNSTCFTALPGGLRSYNGRFGNLGEFGFWWSSTEYCTDNAYDQSLYYYDCIVDRGIRLEKCGFSVRLVKD